MNEDSTGEPKVPGDLGAHHIGEGRNVVHGDQGRGGRDVFFASVQMSRMPMCLSGLWQGFRRDPHTSRGSGSSGTESAFQQGTP